MASLTYRDAGVDIDAGDELVERIKPLAKRTMRPEVLTGIDLLKDYWGRDIALRIVHGAGQTLVTFTDE